MTDTTVTTQAPPPQIPMPNDEAARSPTGEILEPAQIAAQQKTPTTPAPATPAPDATSTSTEEKPNEAKTATPEAYAPFRAPEGYTIAPEVIEAATPIFKELGLSQEAAQRLVDFHTQQMIAAAKAPEDTYTTMRNDWQAKAKSDPEMSKAVDKDSGKTGLDAVKIDMSRALSAIGDPALATEFRSAMDLTGAGDHPAFIKTFWKMAQFITEGKHVAPNNPSIHGQTPPGQAARPDAAHALYPNLS